MRILLLLILSLCLLPQVNAQTTTPIWQVTSYDLNASVQQAERSLSVVATINAINVGGPGRTLTVRLNSKASVKSVTAGGAATPFRPGQEPRGDLQRIEIGLPAPVATNGTATVAVTYVLPVESNTGSLAISPIGTQVLPLSFWYPMPNSPYSVRGADWSPFRLTVNLANAISSGVEKAGGGSVSFEQSLHGEPFFVQ